MTKARKSGKPKYHELFGHFFKDKDSPILKIWYECYNYILEVKDKTNY